ncbi:hypothetical protein SS05631_b51430 (plasmid) [Sinorhizobium sp. CCBAU 05631]|nr:hypothetical protein SS05631_b51430 [Sinorhizobium sp. CCBAU 05631]
MLPSCSVASSREIKPARLAPLATTAALQQNAIGGLRFEYAER